MGLVLVARMFTARARIYFFHAPGRETPRPVASGGREQIPSSTSLDISVLLSFRVDRCHSPGFSLQAANRALIKTYGIRSMILYIALAEP